ncbi:MAG TPA: hypothetical protein VK914_02810 [bacterium]|jgi:tetratricopeptide (TPR) repeat protein|nr:hypothetical protein [bacterium]
MKSYKQCLLTLCMVCVGLAPAAHVFAGARKDFERAVAQLQKNPGDRNLRRRIILLARHLNPPPQKSADVQILEGKAVYLAKSASSPADYRAAVDAYNKATLMAPWDGNLYYNTAVMEQAGGLPGDAIRDFNMYLFAEPNASDKDQVLARIGKLLVVLDKKKQRQQAMAETQQQAAIRAQQQQVLAQENAQAYQSWQAQKTVGAVTTVIGVCGLALGAVEFGVGYGNESSSDYTVSPGYSGGVEYNIYYEGKYWSKASYASYTQGEQQVTAGGVVMLVGVVVTVVGVVIMPGPFHPRLALLNYQDDQLALGIPQVSIMPHGEGARATLLSAQF